MKKKILVIDDDELLTKTFSRLLVKQNYEVLWATRPEDALLIVKERDCDLILCDIRMPGKNGVETIREVQGIFGEYGKNCPPVIFLTGFADPQLEREARALNPFAYVFKPFDTQELLELISAGLE